MKPLAARVAGLLLSLSIAGCAGSERALQREQAAASAAPDAQVVVKPPQAAATQDAGVAAKPLESAAAQGKTVAVEPGPRPPAPSAAEPAGKSRDESGAPPVKVVAPASKPDAPAIKAPAPAPAEASPKKESGAPVTPKPPVTVKAPVAEKSPAPEKPPAPPPLDLTSLEKRLRDTDAIGVFTKLTLKNQVDDLLERFREYYDGRAKTTLAELRQPFDLLILKVLSLLQDRDPSLASAIHASREAIWSILADGAKFRNFVMQKGG